MLVGCGQPYNYPYEVKGEYIDNCHTMTCCLYVVLLNDCEDERLEFNRLIVPEKDEADDKRS